MDAADLATFGSQPEGLGTHLKIRRRLGQVEPFGLPILRRTMYRELVV
jgi:hypothetical protein